MYFILKFFLQYSHLEWERDWCRCLTKEWQSGTSARLLQSQKHDKNHFFWMVVYSWLLWGHDDRREMNDASHDLHDTVTVAAFVSQLEKDHLQQSSGHGRHLWFSWCRHTLLVSECVWGGLHADLSPCGHLLFSNCIMSTIWLDSRFDECLFCLTSPDWKSLSNRKLCFKWCFNFQHSDERCLIATLVCTVFASWDQYVYICVLFVPIPPGTSCHIDLMDKSTPCRYQMGITDFKIPGCLCKSWFVHDS